MMLEFIKDKLKKSRDYFNQSFQPLFKGSIITEDLLSEFESILIQADLGVETAEDVIAFIKKNKYYSREEISLAVRKILVDALSQNLPSRELIRNNNGPSIILFLGVNGSGKTTAIAKLAYKLKAGGNKVILAAADTFRAGAIEQIAVWGERLSVDVIKHKYNADPGAVCFDAVNAAVSRKADYLLIDTAGRFHTKLNLVEELKKIDRTINKRCPGAPHEKLLVIDAITGQNSLIQAREFSKAVNITGIIISKLDGTAKGGIIVPIQKELKVPLKFIGFGQELDDLEVFDPESFAEAII